MCCNYFVDRFRKRKIEGKRGPLHLQRSHERDSLNFVWPETLSMDDFDRRKWRSHPAGYPHKGGFLEFARKTKARFPNLIENEIASLRSIKTQFGLLVKFSIIRDNETILGPLFLSDRPTSIFNKNYEATIEDMFIPWSQSGSGWVIEVFSLEAFLNVAV